MHPARKDKKSLKFSIDVSEVERSELSARWTCLLTVKFSVLMLTADVREVDGLMSVKL